MPIRRNRPVEPTTQPAQRLSDELGVLEQIATHGGDIRWCGPTRCPDCGSFGIVDLVAEGVQHNHCVTCAAQWSFSAKALALFLDARERAADDDISVVGSGVLVDGLDDAVHVTPRRFIGLTAALQNSRQVIIPDDPT
jgi:hypothetical protein